MRNWRDSPKWQVWVKTKLTFIFICSLVFFAALKYGQTKEIYQPPFLLSADEIIHDKELGQITAKGKVELSNGARILLADSINYNQRSGIVKATGNLTLVEPSGEVIFAEHLRLSEGLDVGFIQSIRILLADGSRLFANNAYRASNDRIELSRAIYSPCQICDKHPNRPPIWQLKAHRVIHHKSVHEIEYRDAVLELYGIPIAYTPYFRHVDPLTPRKSGFLPPVLGSSSDLGSTLRIPYFLASSPDWDLTLAPIFTSKEGVVFSGEYRAITDKGAYNGRTSLTYTDKRNDQNERLSNKEFRGHVEASGRIKIDQTWRWGFNLDRATDDTYLRRYRFKNDDVLTSHLFAERSHNRQYFSAAAYSFQGLNAEVDSDTTPYVGPLLDYSTTLQPNKFSGQLNFNASAVSLYRKDGFDSRRVSADGNWQLPYIAPSGEIYTITTGTGLDLYWLNGFDPSGNSINSGGSENISARLRPKIALDWRFPLVRQNGSIIQLIEPIAQVILTPYGGNPKEIPNEDSRSLEFDETNLFSLNRFTGYDRIESGPRINLGMKASVHGTSGGHTSLTMGQVFRVKDDDTFSKQSGLDDHRSDYVMGLTISPSNYFNLTNRLRLDRNKFSLRRNEIYLAVGPKNLRFNTTYVSLDQEQTSEELEAREEIYNHLVWRLEKRWIATLESRRDLSDGGNQIRSATGIQYLDECIGFGLTLEKNFTRDRDVEPSTSINFRFLLQNLG